MKTIAFFNNKGGVGKTTLVYHLAWMFADRGISVLAVDLDPQANLTAMFLDESRLIDLWDNGSGQTIFDSLRPITRGIGDLLPAHVEAVSQGLNLIPGNLALSTFEDRLSESWPKCNDGQEPAFRIITAFHRAIIDAAERCSAELVLIDVGPNLGAINRSALIAAEHVVLPLAPDLFSLQGMKNLGPTLRTWRTDWDTRLQVFDKKLAADVDMPMPSGQMLPIGYVVVQHGIRDRRPVKAYQRWLERIPTVYRNAVLEEYPEEAPSVDQDPFNLALLKHYRSLMPLAMDANKPMFFLKPADGAIGAHVEAVRACYRDFFQLASRIGESVLIPIE